jgi:LacI family transcriptional regulator
VVVIAGDPGERAADVVTADNRAGSAALVTHLIEDHGRRRLYHVDGPPSAPDARERREALNELISAHPRCQLVGSYQGLFSVGSGEEAGEKLLAARGDALPDAVVCANDQMAIGVLQAFAKAGVRVPEQVAVVGFDDIFPGSLYDPPLTTVHQPMRLLGERACTRLLDRIARPALRPKVELLPTELVLRSSCGCPPGTITRRAVPPLKTSRRTARATAAGTTAVGTAAARTAAAGARAPRTTSPVAAAPARRGRRKNPDAAN